MRPCLAPNVAHSLSIGIQNRGILARVILVGSDECDTDCAGGYSAWDVAANRAPKLARRKAVRRLPRAAAGHFEAAVAVGIALAWLLVSG